MGLGNNLLAYVNGLLLALCLGRALALNTPDPYPLAPVINFMLEADIPALPGGESPSAVHLFLDQSSALTELTCGELVALDSYGIIHLRSANQDPHLILSNPRCGAFLFDAFRGLPFFFLSHFVWPGQQELDASFTFVSTPVPQTWDGRRTLRELLGLVKGSVGRPRMLGMHARVCRKMPLHHYDHSHLLPDHLDLYCSGNASSLLSMHRCLRSHLPPLPPGTSCTPDSLAPPRVVLLWATDDEEATRELRRHVEAECGVVVLRIAQDAATPIDPTDRARYSACAEGERRRHMVAALADMQLISAASHLIATPQSSYSFSAHARGLSLPLYGSYARNGASCAAGAGPEAGMITRGKLFTGCHQVGWDMTCQAVSDDDCLGLLYGQDRMGGCLQSVASCWRPSPLASSPASDAAAASSPALPASGGVGGGLRQAPAAFRVQDYLLDIDHLAFFKYFWVRHGGVMRLQFAHEPYPVCWPAPSYRH